MQQEPSHLKSVIPSIATLVVLSVPLFFLLQYMQSLYLSGNIDNLTFGPYWSGASAVFAYTTIGGFLVVSLVAILVYERTSTRARATRMANRMISEALASQQMLLQLYESSPIPYLLISHKGIIQLPNRASVRLLGKKAEELEDKDVTTFFPEESQKNLSLLMSRFQGGSTVNEEEIQVVHSSGAKKWVMLSVYPLKSKERHRNGVMAFVDITERKEVDRAKTEFVSLASHQLRTPLSAIKWYSELLVSGDLGTLTEKQQEYALKVHNSNERMIDLVNTLLNVSRLEMGTLVVEKRQTDIINMAEDVLEELTVKINEKRLRIDREYGTNIPTINTDPKLVRMVLQNLFSNAVKYTPETGSVRISISIEGTGLQILVADTGMGIPQDQHEKVFSKLFRASNAKEKVAEGTGLGLYIVKSVLEKLDGSIKFTSEDGRGTVFMVRIPI
jgi:PAS domain S-box-containing protein